MIKAIFLDMDDTLIVSQALYEAAKEKLYAYMKDFGISREEVIDCYEPADKENFKTYGYSRQRFPATFAAVLKHFVPEADAAMVKTVRDFAETVFNTVAPLKPGAAEAVELLSRYYRVYVFSAGDKSVQQARVATSLPFKDKLSGIFIVDKKDKQAFIDTVQKTGFRPDEVVMIGDSLKSDIVPAIAAGLHSVWVPAQNWSHESVASIPTTGMNKIDSILEAAQRIVKGEIPAELPSKKKLPLPKCA